MTDLDQIQTIDDYFREFSHFHVKKATELLDPLHVPGRDPLPDFSDLTRQPFEPQAHVIAAAVKMLGATHRGMIVAEYGTGGGKDMHFGRKGRKGRKGHAFRRQLVPNERNTYAIATRS